MRSHRIRIRQALGKALYELGMRRLPPRSLAILMYHAVTAQPLNDAGQESISVDLFESQMSMLRRTGVELVDLKMGIDRVATTPDAAPAVSVVFDDGYVGVYDYAAKVLRRYQIPFTVFLPTKWIGQPAFPWSDPVYGRPLTWEEVGHLVDESGCQVGSHTHTHAVLTSINSSEVRDELRRSRGLIETHLNVTPRCFAYPYGSYGTFSPQTRQTLAEEGFTVGCLTVWGRHRHGDDPLSVKRMRVSWCDTGNELNKSLAGCYDWYRFVQYRQARERVGKHV